MMYTRIKISKPTRTVYPSYAPERTAKANVVIQNKSLYGAKYPDFSETVQLKSGFSASAAEKDAEVSSDVAYMLADTQGETADYSSGFAFTAFGRFVCAFFAIIIGAAVLYASEIQAPKYVDRFFMSAFNAVTEKYTEVFAKGVGVSDSQDTVDKYGSTDAASQDSSGQENKDGTKKLPHEVFSVSPGTVQNSYIASIAAETNMTEYQNFLILMTVKEKSYSVPQKVILGIISLKK